MSKEIGFMEIGKRLHAVRGEMDQRAFSRLVNVSQQAISNYERGNLPGSWSFLRRLNEEFNVNLNWLFTGQGFKDYRAGTPYAALADNRSPEWPSSFLHQPAFQDAQLLDLLLALYFLYLFTEPADAKARLMAEFQAIVDVARRQLELPEGSRNGTALLRTLEALATDNRRAAVQSLIAVGEHMERAERGRTLHGARRAYLAALSLARLQGWHEDEVEAARRAGRTYRKEGRWSEAESLFELAISQLPEPEAREVAPTEARGREAGVAPAVAARAFLSYGHLAKHKGEIPAARERYLAALRWAVSGADPTLEAEIQLDLASLSHQERDWQAALDLIAGARALAERAANRRLVGSCQVLEAQVLRGRGELGAAEAKLRALLQQAEAENDGAALTTVAGNLAEVLLDRGRHEEAEQLLRRTAGAADTHGDAGGLALRKVLAARIASARGQAGVARAGFMEALRYARDHGLTREFDQAAAAFEKALESASPQVSKAG